MQALRVRNCAHLPASAECDAHGNHAIPKVPALQQTYLVQEGHKKIKAPILRASKSDLSRRIRFFYFDVKNEGESVIVAKAGEPSDEGKIRKVAERNMDYVLREVGAVLNRFDVTESEGRSSLNDKISDIMQSKIQARKALVPFEGAQDQENDGCQ